MSLWSFLAEICTVSWWKVFMTVGETRIERWLALLPARDSSAICRWLREMTGGRTSANLAQHSYARAVSLLNNWFLQFLCMKCIILLLFITVWSILLWKRDIYVSKWTSVKNYCLTMLVYSPLFKWNGSSPAVFVTISMATLDCSLPPSGSHKVNYVRMIAVGSLGKKIGRFFSTPPPKKNVNSTVFARRD